MVERYASCADHCDAVGQKAILIEPRASSSKWMGKALGRLVDLAAAPVFPDRNGS